MRGVCGISGEIAMSVDVLDLLSSAETGNQVLLSQVSIAIGL